MDRHSMVEKLVAKIISDITIDLKEGDASQLYDILMNGIGFDKKTLREVIDAYNSYEWEDE